MRGTTVVAASLVLAAIALMVPVAPIAARPPFKKAWDQKYLTEGSKIREVIGEKGSCNVCHAGVNKKRRNAYGAALSKLLTKADVNDAEKIDAAFETVAAQHSVADDETSPTFGQMIDEGALPLGAGE